MWGLLWDRGNLALSGKYGVTKDEVDAMFGNGEWVLIEHRTRPRQLLLVGAIPDTSPLRLIYCVVEFRHTTQGRRLRPIVAHRTRGWHQRAWDARSRQESR